MESTVKSLSIPAPQVEALESSLPIVQEGFLSQQLLIAREMLWEAEQRDRRDRGFDATVIAEVKQCIKELRLTTGFQHAKEAKQQGERVCGNFGLQCDTSALQ